MHWKAPFNNPGSLSYVFCVYNSTCVERSCCKRLQWENQCNLCNVIFATLAFRHSVYNQKNYFFANAIYSVLVSIFISSYLLVSQILLKKTVKHLPYSQLSAMQEKLAYNDWCCMFDFGFGQRSTSWSWSLICPNHLNILLMTAACVFPQSCTM